MSKLLKLKTDLKSLKFDPNNEPYILFPIGYTKSFEKNDSIPQSITDFYLSNRTNPDFPLRGGTIDVDPRTLTFTRSSQIDKERIKKFLEDKPRGPIFILKQIGLQLSNPKIETDAVLPNLFSRLENGGILLENTRFYNKGINTLAQVGVQGTGIHGVRHGAIPFNPLQKMYYDTVNQQNLDTDNGYKSNRLIALKQIKLSNNPDMDSRNQAALLGIALGPQNLFQYFGGPDSVYGVGNTTIRRYVNTENAVNNIAKGPNSSKYSALVKRNYKEIDDAADQLSTIKDGIQTFKVSGRSSYYNIGDPGNKSEAYDSRVDKMNMNPIIYYDAKDSTPFDIKKDGFYPEDIIKFVFEAVDNDNTQNASAVFFRAFLSGMSDTHNATITPYKYLGRGEEFYTYQGANRQIGFSFKIAPQTDKEQEPLYQKLNYLISQVYPDYSTIGIMRAPLMRLTIGDYFYRLPGFIENISITVDDNVPWEVLNFKGGKVFGNLRQLPHVINVQCSFKAIHEFLPRREKYTSVLDKDGFTKQGSQYEDMNVPFIVNDDTNFIKGEVFDNTVKIKPFQNQAEQIQASDEEINANFQNDQRPLSEVLNLRLQKYKPPRKINAFETELGF